ncbi:DedA family protein [Micromonospora sp. NPDC048170]|uniref:DedA family protein n=1 Tax=Micromonospora sp. NPDC048170 TaxID=3154819 RepID=UPI0033F0A8E4
MALAENVDPTRLGGLTGWVAGVIDAAGAIGVALLVALESIIPPIPSEIVLAMAGYLASEGRFNVVLVWAAATVGSLAGALVLYWLGAAAGEDRLKRWLDRLPLVDLDDLEKADRWFERHGRWAVLFGRMMPVVRSLISVPAGANRMPLPEFVAFTTLGSGVWNALFVGLGYALGSRWQQIEQYSKWFDYGIIAAFVVAIAWWAIKKTRRRRAHAAP